jgi:hypothetical protein
MVATKAKARGTPAKLEATPEKVSRKCPQPARQPAQDDGVGQQEAKQGATCGGDQADGIGWCLYALTISLTVKRAIIFSIVKSPARVWKLRTKMDTEGRNRKRVANRKNGATPSQSQFAFRGLGRANGASRYTLDFLSQVSRHTPPVSTNSLKIRREVFCCICSDTAAT